MNNTLEFLMNSKSLNKTQLAKELGITRQTILRITKGNPPSMEIGLKIAKYFNKDVSDIFFTPSVKHIERTKKAKSA